MSDYWRMQAKYETDCARCPDLIFVGTTIVQTEDDWCHAVCPSDLERLSNRPLEESTLKEVRIRVGEDGEMIQEEITAEEGEDHELQP
jgi:hypothetical protein